MDRPPRPRSAGVVDRGLLLRAWLLLGTISAVLVMGGFLITLVAAGWHLGDATGPGSPLHQAYLEATTITFAGIVACQIGTAFAARTDRASLYSVGLRSNPLLLWGIAFELVFTAAVIYVPWFQDVVDTAALHPAQLAVVVPFPFVVWGADEIIRWIRRRHSGPPVRDLVHRRRMPCRRTLAGMTRSHGFGPLAAQVERDVDARMPGPCVDARPPGTKPVATAAPPTGVARSRAAGAAISSVHPRAHIDVTH